MNEASPCPWITRVRKGGGEEAMLRYLELGTGILLLVTDTHLRGVMITIGTWALPSTLLIVEAFRARGLARLILEGGPRPQNVRIGVPRPGTLRRSLTQVMSLSGGCALHARLT